MAARRIRPRKQRGLHYVSVAAEARLCRLFSVAVPNTGTTMTDKKFDTETAAAIDLLQDLVARARKAGAEAADAVLFEGVSLSHARRLGKTERLERSEGQDLGLRVLVGKQQAIVSSSDRSAKTLAELVDRAVAMAKAVPEDTFCGLADPADITHDWPTLDMLDPAEPAAEILIERARAAEDAALAVPGITNSEGAEAGWAGLGSCWRHRTGLLAAI